ncbi:MAG TPA: DUF6691 family protein [Usitatibacter sp.]|nr:DUF6691 family protein [Usitatibacter sp.]
MSARDDGRALEVAMAAVVGLLFGAGLLLSGMSNPAKVLGFLDLAGAWDPSLALVMVGAIALGSLGLRLAGRQTQSVLGLPMQLPACRDIDWRLAIGAAAFGIGWGLVGLCPGPALVALASGAWEAIVFMAAMLAGMALHDFPSIRPRRDDA